MMCSAGRGCGGRLFNYGGVFTSPMYPSNYRNNSQCRWDVSVPIGTQPVLKFTGKTAHTTSIKHILTSFSIYALVCQCLSMKFPFQHFRVPFIYVKCCSLSPCFLFNHLVPSMYFHLSVLLSSPDFLLATFFIIAFSIGIFVG
jgi:hypothetical protein